MNDQLHPANPATAPISTRVRVSTVMWGLVVALIGVVLFAVLAGFVIDLGLAVIGLLCIAGAGLIIGSVISGRSRS